jgi:hypothetical protein
MDTSAYSEYVQVIKCDFTPVSVEKSIVIGDEKGIPQQQPMKIEKLHSGIPLYGI